MATDTTTKNITRAGALAPSEASVYTTPPLDDAGAKYRILGLVRILRENAINAENALEVIAEKSKVEDRSARTSEVEAAFLRARKVFERSEARISTCFVSIDRILLNRDERHDYQDELFGGHADMIERMRHYWEATMDAWKPKLGGASITVGEVDEVTRMAARTQESLHALAYRAARFTVPNRLNEHLKLVDPGAALDFHATFKDEIERKEERDDLLHFLKARAGAIHGVVVPDPGHVIKFDPRAWRRNASLGIVMLVAVLGFAVPLLAGYIGLWFAIEGWPFNAANSRDYVGIYVLLLLGAIIHLGVDALKQANAGRGGGFTALDKFGLWAHINEVQLVKSVASLWVVLVGLMLLKQEPDWFTVIALGYGVDSVVDIYLKRFDEKAKAIITKHSEAATA